MINGKALCGALRIWNPNLLKQIEIPNEDFLLSDIVANLVSVFFPGKNL